MGPQRDSKGPWGPDLIPTAANWSDWVGFIVTTNFGLVLGPLLDPEGPKEGPFWHKMTQYGAKIQNVANLSCGQLAREGHPANEKKKHSPNFEFGPLLGPMWFKKGHL